MPEPIAIIGIGCRLPGGANSPEAFWELLRQGRDAIADFITGVLVGVTTVHHGHMMEVEVLSPTTAHAITAMEDELWWPEGSPVSWMHGYGHYDEDYVYEDGAWRISCNRLTRLRVDVRIHTHGDARFFAEARGDGIDERQLGFGLAVKAVNAAGERVLHLFARLADTGEDHLFRAAAGAEDAVELTAGDDVEAGAFGGEEAEDAQIRVGLDGVEDFVGRVAEGVVVAVVALADGGGGVDVGGRAGGAGDVFELDVFDEEVAVTVSERGERHQDTRRIRTVWSSN